MATLIRSGRWFDKDAYKEILKFLKKTKRVCAIIPEDDVAVMETHLNRFMRVFEEQGHTVLRNRTLFDGIQILVGKQRHRCLHQPWGPGRRRRQRRR